MDRPLARTLVRLGAVALVVACALGAGVAAADGWRWPLGGPADVVRPFDPPAQQWGPGHRGVDIRGRPGAAVRAAGPGVVGYAGLLAGRGVVTIRHAGGLETTYEPVDPLVAPGEDVAGGAVIGRLGSGHGDCGLGYACLHWGVRRGSAYENPLDLVGAGPVRLLPVPGDPFADVTGTPTSPESRTSPAPASDDGPPSPGTAGGTIAALAVGIGVAAVVSRRRAAAR